MIYENRTRKYNFTAEKNLRKHQNKKNTCKIDPNFTIDSILINTILSTSMAQPNV